MSEHSDAEQLLELLKAPLQHLELLRRAVEALRPESGLAVDDSPKIDDAINDALLKIERARKALETVEYKAIEGHEHLQSE